MRTYPKKLLRKGLLGACSCSNASNSLLPQDWRVVTRMTRLLSMMIVVVTLTVKSSTLRAQHSFHPAVLVQRLVVAASRSVHRMQLMMQVMLMLVSALKTLETLRKMWVM